jgi:ribonuclease P protein component
LEKSTRYTLGKEERLKSRKAIDRLFKEGKQFNLFPFRIVYQLQNLTTQKNEQPLQAGFTASSRHFKKAVDRNRIKRLLREAYRLQKNSLKELLAVQNKQVIIFFMYNGNEIPDYKLVFEKIETAIHRLTKIIKDAQ